MLLAYQGQNAERAALGPDEVLRIVLEACQDAMVVLDDAGGVVAANAAARRLLALGGEAPREAIDGVFRSDEVTPYPARETPLSRALRGDVTDRAELFIRNTRMPRGAHVVCTGHPLRDEDGHIKGAVLSLRDITESRRAHQMLARTQARLGSIVASTPNVAIEGYDREGHVLCWNPAAERMFGWSECEAMGKRLDQLMLDRDAARSFEDVLDRVARTREAAGPWEWSCRHRGGESVFVYSTIFPIPALDGGTEIVCMDVDITPLHEAEERLRSHTHRLESLLSFSAAVAGARLDSGKLTAAVVQNVGGLRRETCALRLRREETNELVLAAIHRVTPDGVQHEAHQLQTPPRLDGGPWARALAQERPLMVPWGERKSVIIVPLLAQQHVVGTLDLWRHHTEPLAPDDEVLLRQIAERAALAIDNANLFAMARDAVRVREEFLSIASHELRTPLTPLELQMQLLRRNLQQVPPEVAEPLLARVEMADRQVRRLRQLMQNLLDLTRITANHLALQRQPVDLGELVRDVTARAASDATKAGCEVSLSTEGPVTGHWDRLRLDLVVTNLLANALKYGSGRPVNIDVRGDQDVVRLTVRDHGIGIAVDDQARIFERMERAVSGLHYGGLGLGLWIVRQIALAHGGRVEVESRIGLGATFTVELPRKTPEPGAAT